MPDDLGCSEMCAPKKKGGPGPLPPPAVGAVRSLLGGRLEVQGGGLDVPLLRTRKAAAQHPRRHPAGPTRASPGIVPRGDSELWGLLGAALAQPSGVPGWEPTPSGAGGGTAPPGIADTFPERCCPGRASSARQKAGGCPRTLPTGDPAAPSPRHPRGSQVPGKGRNSYLPPGRTHGQTDGWSDGRAGSGEDGEGWGLPGAGYRRGPGREERGRGERGGRLGKGLGGGRPPGAAGLAPSAAAAGAGCALPGPAGPAHPGELSPPVLPLCLPAACPALPSLPPGDRHRQPGRAAGDASPALPGGAAP